MVLRQNWHQILNREEEVQGEELYYAEGSGMLPLTLPIGTVFVWYSEEFVTKWMARFCVFAFCKAAGSTPSIGSQGPAFEKP